MLPPLLSDKQIEEIIGQEKFVTYLGHWLEYKDIAQTQHQSDIKWLRDFLLQRKIGVTFGEDGNVVCSIPMKEFDALKREVSSGT